MNNNYIEESLENYISYISGVLRLSERTIDAYRYDLTEFITCVRNRGKRMVKDIDKEDVETFLAQITKSKSGSSANYNRKLSSIKSFFNYLSNNGLKNNIAGDLKLIKNHIRQISYLTEKEKNRLLRTIKQEATPYYRKRDLAVISLFLNVGIRVSELSNLEIRDIDFRKEGCSYIRIKRKGGSEDRLPISPIVANRIKTYLHSRADIDENNVFLSRKKLPLMPNSIYYLVRGYLIRAGIRKKKMGPHILRHTVGVSLLKNGVDLVTIQKILGHKRLDTTSIYLHVEPKDVEKAIQSIAI